MKKRPSRSHPLLVDHPLDRASQTGETAENRLRNDFFELQAWSAGRLVCGVDEAGRGPLAGPVVAAAVILNPQATHPLLKDSKTLTAPQLEEGYAWVTHHSRFGVGLSDHRVIDRINILQATKQAMYRALGQLQALHRTFPPQYLLIDAVPLTGPWADAIEHFPFGESRSISIAAASIIAKVTRDRLMTQQDKLFPAYAFAAHKGYGTARHTRALAQQGPCIIHRASFIHATTLACKEESHAAPSTTQSAANAAPQAPGDTQQTFC